MKKIWERIGPISKAGRRFDIEFWQAQSASTRFRVSFDMLKDFYRLKRKRINAHTFRLQRTVENLKQRYMDIADIEHLGYCQQLRKKKQKE